MVIPHDAAMPATVSRDFSGRLSMWRAIMRVGWENSRCMPSRSISVGRYAAGGSGRMASAGGRRTARSTAYAVPVMPATTLTTLAPTISYNFV